MRHRMVFTLAFAMLGAFPAQAQTVSAQDPQTLVRALQRANLPARAGTDQAGNPMITSSAAGTTYQIFFFGCTDRQNCTEVQFYSGYDIDGVTLEQINNWNRSRRFARAFLDRVNQPILQMDINLDDGGVPLMLFIDNVEYWFALVSAFERHIGFQR